MKKTYIFYWISTGLLSALMIFSAIPDIISSPEAVEIITNHLGYPAYFLPFIGVAKLLGAIAILIPGFPRIKEWAYAGLFYDVVAAMYSGIAVGDPVSSWAFIFIAIALIFVSYFFYHRRKSASSKIVIK